MTETEMTEWLKWLKLSVTETLNCEKWFSNIFNWEKNPNQKNHSHHKKGEPQRHLEKQKILLCYLPEEIISDAV